MRRLQFSLASQIGLLIGLCGCYHYAYPPYGAPYGMGPTYPAPPGDGTMTPGPTYIPYGSPSGPSPTPINPNGSPSQPQWRQPDGGSAPPYSPGNSGDKSVPQPTDDEQPFGGGAPPGARLMPNGAPATGGLSSSGVQLQPIESGPLLPSSAAPPTTTVVGNDPFESPMRTTAGGATVAARTASLGENVNRPNPFAYDARNFTWLRGIVDYDPQDQRWVIVYSANPDAADKYGGSMTLSDHPLFSRIKPGDVVLVEGSVDAASLDQHGKPIYRIDKLQPLKPKS